MLVMYSLYFILFNRYNFIRLIVAHYAVNKIGLHETYDVKQRQIKCQRFTL